MEAKNIKYFQNISEGRVQNYQIVAALTTFTRHTEISTLRYSSAIRKFRSGASKRCGAKEIFAEVVNRLIKVQECLYKRLYENHMWL